MKETKKQALERWEKLRKSTRSSTPIDVTESPASKSVRVAKLLSNWEDFMQYYFPAWCAAPFAPFHRRFAKAVVGRKAINISREWARDHSKTTFTQMMVIYLALKEDFKVCLWVSKSYDAAEEMLLAIKLQFEENQRLIHDFGSQRTLGTWENGRFVLKNGVSFRALGRSQSPRGTKQSESRPDLIVCDDLDDDELVRSQEQLQKAWEWMMGALFAAMSIGGFKRFIVLNNRIAGDSLMGRFIPKSQNHERINILDDAGQPSWKERFSLEECNHMIESLGTHLAQREYFNNPVIAGSTFKKEWIQWKKMDPIGKYKYLVAYLDPSFKDKKNSDHKSWLLVGLVKGEVHIIKAYCSVASVQEMVGWGYELDALVKSKNGACMFWMEEVFLQDLLYKDFAEAAQKRGYSLSLRGDTRKKPDKDARIAATSGEFERGMVYFNQAEADNRHMQTLVEEFLLFKPGNTRIKKDGPDAYEGARFKLQEMITTSQPVGTGMRSPHDKRF